MPAQQYAMGPGSGAALQAMHQTQTFSHPSMQQHGSDESYPAEEKFDVHQAKRQRQENRCDELNLTQEQINMLASSGVKAVALDEKNGVKVQIATDNKGNTTTITLPKRIEEMDEKELERVLKKERRKQSNRESARRSRLRKQAEVERLNSTVTDVRSKQEKLEDNLQRHKDVIRGLIDIVKRLGAEDQIQHVAYELADLRPI